MIYEKLTSVQQSWIASTDTVLKFNTGESDCVLKVKFWRDEIDVDGDGVPDDIVTYASSQIVDETTGVLSTQIQTHSHVRKASALASTDAVNEFLEVVYQSEIRSALAAIGTQNAITLIPTAS